MKRYSGRTGWMWMGWFGRGGYLGGPILAKVRCMVKKSLRADQRDVYADYVYGRAYRRRAWGNGSS